MVNPVGVIGASRNRIARVAALRRALRLAPPAMVAALLGLSFDQLGALTWQRMGYVVAPAIAAGLRAGLLGAGVGGLALAAFMSWREFRRASDFLAAAERVDRLVDGQQEIVTLASLEQAGGPQARSSLFPILLRRTVDYLSEFDPVRQFRFEVGPSLLRSSLLSLAVVVVLGLSMLALVRPPSPSARIAERLRGAAEQLASAGGGAGASALAARLRAAAAALENPSLPPKAKLEVLAAIDRALEENEREQNKGSAAAQKGKSASGSGQGKSDKGKGSGQGQSASARNNGGGGKKGGAGSGPGNKDKGKRNEQIVELRKELRNAQARIESSQPNAGKPQTLPGESKQGQAPKAGAGPDRNKPGKQGQKMQDVKQPGAAQARNKTHTEAKREAPNQRSGADSGDTHLGQFPAPTRYERFYKLGEKGPALEVRNAKYVLFRIPPAPSSGNSGKTVLDKQRPEATTPYANVPLKPERLKATPDERQLVPPRYRDLIQ